MTATVSTPATSTNPRAFFRTGKRVADTGAINLSRSTRISLADW